MNPHAHVRQVLLFPVSLSAVLLEFPVPIV